MRRLFPYDVNSADFSSRISIGPLLKRFDAEAIVTAQNADSVAEEILWTKRMGIGDGTHKSLPQARRAIQAAILENLNFDVGNPAHSAKDKAAKASAKLIAALKLATKTWQDAAAEK